MLIRLVFSRCATTECLSLFSYHRHSAYACIGTDDTSVRHIDMINYNVFVALALTWKQPILHNVPDLYLARRDGIKRGETRIA